MQIPSVPATWVPILGTSQFINASSSTSLTLPTQAQIIAASGGASRAGCEIAAIIIAQAQAQWIRTDGSAVTAAVTGGLKLQIGDWRQVEGRNALSNLRVIRDADLGSLTVEYYIYRAAPDSRF